MTLLTRRRDDHRGGDREMIGHTIGNALVVHPRHELRNEIRDLALGLAADPEHELVVVDLPMESSMAVWEAAAKLLPRKRRGLRLVISGRPRETTALAGQWLSERLGRTVIAPDGAVLSGADGTLFVDSGWGTGWRRFQPGKLPKLDGKRFPRPAWDEVSSLVEIMPTSAGGVAEPLPAGVWLRPRGDEKVLRQHRKRLIESLPCQPGVCVVVLGCPGARPVTMHDVARFWSWMPEPLRERIRMVAFGPVTASGPVGQSVADALGSEITWYTGMPVGSRHEPDVFTVRADGGLGWRALAEEMSYLPARQGEPAPPPALMAYSSPFAGIDEIAPAVYRYSAHAVLEVVQSGLWLRPPHEVGHAAAIRSAEPDASRHVVLFEDDEHLRELAGDVHGRLDPATRRLSTVVRADSLLRQRVQAGRALGIVEAAPVRPEASALDDTLVMWPVAAVPNAVSAPPSAAPLAVIPLAAAPAPVALTPVAPTPAATASAATTSAPVTSAPVTSAPVEFDGVIQLPGAGPGLPTATDVPAAVAPVGLAETLAPSDPFAVAAPAAPVVEPVAVQPAPSPAPGPSEPSPPEPVAPRTPGPVASLVQPTPESAAAALVPDRGVDEERAWLRRALSREYAAVANSVSRVLSESPGFQGALERSSGGVLTDAAAIRLYLSRQGDGLDLPLRSGAVGPHVPFARCVVSGLSRLPSHRGAAVFSASPTAREWELYRSRRYFTEWGFVNALTTPCAGQRDATEADVLLWSMTARRTKLLEPDEDPVTERVLFVPGTSFKVLDLVEPAPGRRGLVLVRELAAGEIDESGRVDGNRASLDELAVNTLRRSLETWAVKGVRVPEAAACRFGTLPGLVRTPEEER
ncbi:hypothetical protein [Lentzea sp. NPDC055074]